MLSSLSLYSFCMRPTRLRTPSHQSQILDTPLSATIRFGMFVGLVPRTLDNILVFPGLFNGNFRPAQEMYFENCLTIYFWFQVDEEEGKRFFAFPMHNIHYIVAFVF